MGDLRERAPLTGQRREHRLGGGVDEQRLHVARELVAGRALDGPVAQLLARLQDLLDPDPLDAASPQPLEIPARVGEAVDVIDPQTRRRALRRRGRAARGAWPRTPAGSSTRTPARSSTSKNRLDRARSRRRDRRSGGAARGRARTDSRSSLAAMWFGHHIEHDCRAPRCRARAARRRRRARPRRAAGRRRRTRGSSRAAPAARARGTDG